MKIELNATEITSIRKELKNVSFDITCDFNNYIIIIDKKNLIEFLIELPNEHPLRNKFQKSGDEMRWKEIPKFTRKEIFKMTTQELYDLNSDLQREKNKVKSELIARGDY